MLGSLNKLLRPFFCPPYLSIKITALEGGYFFVLLETRRTDSYNVNR